ncbi:P-loop containing nucleoside triphosphate hydrolase protein [Vararia minispora EC-137]|uniref:P-loop containing nucleoside triphosphate hydrolase protein n=1 Tax=Vararia minispora EC-137 TaxID=1314806 RepID=A0ACB8QK45_9AGAM|nr:P-loop containing nucleoside triphosphate hydrolase protein [Vararia minispora EC-137]
MSPTEGRPDYDTPHSPSQTAQAEPARERTEETLFNLWQTSRALLPSQTTIGATRPLNRKSIALAHRVARMCATDVHKLFWSDHPYRMLFLLALSFARGVFPVFKGYSHAMIINEIQSLFVSNYSSWARLTQLVGAEVLRMAGERLLESFAADNEQFLQNSIRFLVEYQQLEQRVRLDVPTLSDPVIRDLLAESDMFVASFQALGGFGFTSPFNVIRVFTLLSEIISHLFVLSSVPHGTLPFLALLLSLASAAAPFFRQFYGPRFDARPYSASEMRQAERQEQMRQLVFSETHRPEVMLFGLGPWIMNTWSSARRTALDIQNDRLPHHFPLEALLAQVNMAQVIASLHNVPFMLMLQSSTALGSLALYRTSAQAFVLAISSLFATAQAAIQSIFLMGAFCAFMELKPQLRPLATDRAVYAPRVGGMKIEARNIAYTYPGASEPALKDVNLTLEAGETLALVGYNGSGKSTLAKLLLRIIEFDSGELLVNDVDIRRYDPVELHAASAAVFQNFARYDTTVAENVGTGFVHDIERPTAVRKALRLAQCEQVVDGLPYGIDTRLDSDTSSASPSPVGTSMPPLPERTPHGLSGGEWQRIALARAFMRANRPEIDLLVFDEPTSALDAQAQAKIFDTIDTMSRSSSGQKCKTVVFITHRLSTARRADKVAMMENGRVIEFGSHEDLLARDGSYAALYQASV